MRTLPAWRVIALIALLAALAVVSLPDRGITLADDNDGNSSGQGSDDDDDSGQGEDGDDDNSGEGNNGADNSGQGRNDDNAVATAAAYTIEVTCASTADATQTACEFQAIAPPGGKKVSHVVVPAAVACAGVVGGDAEFVDPDPNAHVTGYRETHDAFTMVFDGLVTPAGTATYWVKAAAGVYPATGPGLACNAPASAAETASTPAPATPAPETGTVVVVAYACQGVPADTSAYDWFGACTPGGPSHRYLLDPAENASDDLFAAGTNDTGSATFADLAPGAYALDDPDGNWCHAESDNVNAESDIVVAAGAETTVWLFYCEGG
jgi:hypothetical protein